MAKQNTIENKKTYRLADLLDCELWCALGLMEAFWDWAGRQAQDGDVTRVPLSQIADGVKWRRDPKLLMRLLRECEIVDELPGGTLYVHDFHDHAPDFVRKRLERSGKTFANGIPPRMPKEGYAQAGFVAPKALPYTPEARDTIATTARQTPEKPAPVARQRRDRGETTTPKNDPLGEMAARQCHDEGASVASLVRAEAHPSPEQNREDLVTTCYNPGKIGFPRDTPPGEPPSSGGGPSTAASLVVASRAPLGSTFGEGEIPSPNFEPGKGADWLARYRREGETDDQARQRYRAERLAADGERPPLAHMGVSVRG